MPYAIADFLRIDLGVFFPPALLQVLPVLEGTRLNSLCWIGSIYSTLHSETRRNQTKPCRLSGMPS